MPIYEYQCDACGHRMEAIQKISDDPLKICPECGAESLRKLVSAASFRLKGTGWYETDFKNKSTGKTDKKPEADSKDKPAKESKTGSEASSGGTTDKKAAGASD